MSSLIFLTRVSDKNQSAHIGENGWIAKLDSKVGQLPSCGYSWSSSDFEGRQSLSDYLSIAHRERLLK